MRTPVGYNGRGTQLTISADGENFLPLPQLTKFEPDGSKQKSVDSTDLGSAQLGFTTSLALQVESGGFSIEGVFDPQDPVLQLVAQLHGARVLASCFALLSDNVTSYFFQAYVSDWKPFSATVSKMMRFTGKLRVSGPLYLVNGSAFQPGAFQPAAFQIVTF